MEIIVPLFEVLIAAGLPVFWAALVSVLSALLIWAVWRVGRFLRDEVVRPMVGAHLAMLKQSMESTATNSRLHAAQTNILDALQESVASINQTLGSLACRNGEHSRNGETPSRESRPGIPRREQ